MDLLYMLEITMSSMLIVFGILTLIMLIIMLFKFIPNEKEEVKEQAPAKKSIPFESMDEDMKVAVLVATIECEKEYNKNVVLKSVRKI